MESAPKIINPFAEEKAKKLADGKIMDIKAMARQLVLNSYAAGSKDCRISSEEAFEIAREHKAIEEKLYPKHNTEDGTGE